MITFAFSFVFLGCRTFERDIREAIEQELSAESADTVLASVYRDSDYKPVWVRPRGLSGDGEAFLDRIVNAHRDGLPPDEYPGAALRQKAENLYEDPPAADDERARALADLELKISEAFMRYADHLANGRLDPEEKLADYHVRHDELDPAIAFRQVAETDVNEALDAFAARRNGEPQLRAALARYHDVAAEGGWPQVPDEGRGLSDGDEEPAVAALHRRLAADGFADEDVGADRFAERLKSAVERFQRSRGLQQTGEVDAATLAALNTPVEDDIERIVVNLERIRSLPSDFGERYIFVNIPDFHLRVVEDDRDVMTMRVVVGEQMHPTPVFADTMTYLAFSPYWNVPTGIASRDIVPSARDDPGYLSANGYQIVDRFGPDATVYEAISSNIDRVDEGDLFVRQRPGPQNALGRVKYMFPNEWAIYLHDTPEGHLFREEDRGFSNGCIRVERPADLAEYLLKPNDWDRSRIENAMGLSDEKTVTLERPIPVYLMYLTVWVDDRGEIQFRNDIYGHDARLMAELGGAWRSATTASKEP